RARRTGAARERPRRGRTHGTDPTAARLPPRRPAAAGPDGAAKPAAHLRAAVPRHLRRDGAGGDAVPARRLAAVPARGDGRRQLRPELAAAAPSTHARGRPGGRGQLSDRPPPRAEGLPLGALL